MFLNSHLLSEVEQVCSRVAILANGRLVREGTVEALTTTGRAWRLRSTAVPREAAERLGPALTLDAGSPAEPDLVRHLLTVPDRAALNAALDALRAAGVEVEAVEPLRQSLEDLFVDVVSQPDGAEAPEPAPPEPPPLAPRADFEPLTFPAAEAPVR